MPYTFLVGGARSGKSSLAVRLASRFDGVAFVATARARDDEMAARIRAHIAARPEGWETIEEPLRLAKAISGIRPDAAVILDCLTLWVSNLLEAGGSADEIEREAATVASMLAERPGPGIVVSNEVGLGIVPMHELARTYRDVLGRVNTAFADAAARSFFVVAGKGLPLEGVTLA